MIDSSFCRIEDISEPHCVLLSSLPEPKITDDWMTMEIEKKKNLENEMSESDVITLYL